MLLKKCAFVLFAVIMMSSMVWAEETVHHWSQRFGDTENQTGLGVAVDASGNSIVTGYFNGTVDFGGGGRTSAGGTDIFVAKFDSSGTHLWSQRFGDSSDQYANSVAVDASGNVIVTGYFAGTVNFGGADKTSAGGTDIFVAKYGPGGTHLWSKRFGNEADQRGMGVTVDGSGNVIVTGFFKGTVDFGGGNRTSAGDWDIFVVKFDPSGTHIWSKHFGDNQPQFAYEPAVDSSGNVIVTGYFAGTVNFGGSDLTDSQYDIFVAKFDPSGTHLWSHDYGGVNYQVAHCAAVDNSGNVIVTGSFKGSVNFGGDALTSVGAYDIYVAKFDPSSTHIWSKGFGSGVDDYAYSVAVDNSGNVIVTGRFQGTVNFGGGNRTSAGAYDIFIAKYDSSGTHIWSQGFGDANNQIANCVAAEASGNVIVTGGFEGTVDFGGGTLTSAGINDIFLAKFRFLPIPVLSLITDVGNDQGRQVRISFLSSDRDAIGSPTPIIQYEAFRRIDLLPSTSAIGTTIRKQNTGMLSEQSILLAGWEYVGAIPAHGELEYNMIVPTLADSTLNGIHWSAFFIRAATTEPLVYFDSEPDSGYSVDNCAPCSPLCLAGEQSVLPQGLSLRWNANTEEDLDHYAVYRSDSDNFIPDEINRIAAPCDTTYFDDEWSWNSGYFYKISAIDVNGNESPFALLSPDEITGSEPPPAYLATFLSQNIPNPFNPTTRIIFGIEKAGDVSLGVYDVNGGLVRRLVDEWRPASEYEEVWDGKDDSGTSVGSGVYFYRMQTEAKVLTRKMVLLK